MASSLSSALSPKVRRLITEVGVHNELSLVKFLSSSGIICWEKLTEVLPDPRAQEDRLETDIYFEKCIYWLAYLFRECDEHLRGMTLDDFDLQYRDLIIWTGQEKVIRESFSLKQTDRPTDNYIGLLLLTSCLERALGDVYLLENTVCPSMLKDILSSATLKKTFGDNVVQVLRAVIGPPSSLNLRNVIWHGFPSEQELSKRYSSFLLLVIPSLKQFISCQVPHREAILFPQDNLYKAILPNVSDITIDEVNNLIDSSNFIPRYHQCLWKSAMSVFYHGQHGMAVVMFLPLLEHGLRCLFSVVNNCPDRTVTAEATTLYTTLDEILHQYVTDSTENKLPLEIGYSVMDILLDLFTYPSGPRIRDKLSHGEADVFTFPVAISTAVFVVTVYLAAKYQIIVSSCDKQWLKSIITWTEQYETLFHPVSLVKSKLKSVMVLTGEFSKHIELTYKLDNRTGCDDNEIIDPDFKENGVVSKEVPVLIILICNKWNIKRSAEEIHNGLFSPFIDCSACLHDMLSTKIQTLYRYQKDTGSGNSESEIVTLLLRICVECETIVEQIFSSLRGRQEQLKNKLLRSRQRNNLQSLIKSCFVFHQSLHLVLLLITCHLVVIDTKPDQQKSNIKFLKMLLQYTENVRTFTNSDNNKWIESVNLSIKMLDKIKQYLT